MVLIAAGDGEPPESGMVMPVALLPEMPVGVPLGLPVLPLPMLPGLGPEYGAYRSSGPGSPEPKAFVSVASITFVSQSKLPLGALAVAAVPAGAHGTLNE